MFDEQPDGDLHGECALEIENLKYKIRLLEREVSSYKAQASNPVAYEVRNGVVSFQIWSEKEMADRVAAEQQKRHDLSGSLAAFHVVPLYEHPLPSQKPVARANRQGFIVENDDIQLAEGTLLYTTPPDAAAQIAELKDEWERECSDGDKLLKMLGIAIPVGRTEGGSLNIGKLREIIGTRQAIEQINQDAAEKIADMARNLNQLMDKYDELQRSFEYQTAMKDHCGAFNNQLQEQIAKLEAERDHWKAHPAPRRELSDDEINEIADQHSIGGGQGYGVFPHQFARAILAKAEEKE